jgi:hypothetical protein
MKAVDKIGDHGEDHPYDYKDFLRCNPEGNYGEGKGLIAWIVEPTPW